MEKLTEKEWIYKYTGKLLEPSIERLLTADKIVILSMNEITLVNAVREGKIIPYRENTIEPIDVKSIGEFFLKLKESFKIHIDNKNYEKGYYFSDFEDKFRFHIDYEITHEQPIEEFYEFLSENMKSWGEDNEIIEHFHNESTGISHKRYQEIINGWGNKQLREIVFNKNTVFKEREVRFETVTKGQLRDTQKKLQDFTPTLFDKKSQATSEIKPELEQLEKLSLEKLWPAATRQQKEGFETFKNKLKENFQTGIRAAVAVLAYCHHQNKKLSFQDLVKLLDYPEKEEGAGSLQTYKKKISKELAQNIYAELPNEYRYARGEKKSDKPLKPTEP